MDWNEFIQTALVNYALPLVGLAISILLARYLIPWLKKLERSADTELKKMLAGLAVSYVEQINDGLKKKEGLEGVAMSSETKKDRSITKYAALLANNKVKMSLDDMGDMIESVLGSAKKK